MTVWKLALAGAAMTSLLLVFAYRSFPPAEEPAQEAQEEVLKKTDREPIVFPDTWKERFIMESKKIHEKIQEKIQEAEPKKMQEAIQEATKPKPKAEKENNLCTRHGMHKVITRGGKSWRCRK